MFALATTAALAALALMVSSIFWALRTSWMKWLDVVSRVGRGLRLRLVFFFLSVAAIVGLVLLESFCGERDLGGEFGGSGSGPFGGGSGSGGRAVMLMLSLDVMFSQCHLLV